MSKSSKTNNWVKRHSKDPFVKKSRTDRYRSRAAYKLKSIDEKYDVLKNVQCVVDLGCAPGSWLQVLQEHSNIREIFGIDVLDLDSFVSIQSMIIESVLFLAGLFIIFIMRSGDVEDFGIKKSNFLA